MLSSPACLTAAPALLGTIRSHLGVNLQAQFVKAGEMDMA